MGVLLLFFDGVGIGADDPGTNPFASIGARRLSAAAGREADPDAAFRPLDMTLGVAGLPQSATGQTTLYTGLNAARHAGRHMQGLPGPTLRPLLEEHGLFRRLVAAGRRPAFANGYTRAHLESRRPRWGSTTWMVRASGVPLRLLDPGDGPAEPCLFHDWTGEWGVRWKLPVPPRTVGQAAAVLAALLGEHDLVLYEYFLTDLAGHRGTAGERLLQAGRAEELTAAVLEAVDLARHRVVVVSDHGNLEDSGHDRHTRNPVPLLAWGHGAGAFVDRVRAPEDLTPALLAP